MKRKYVQRDDMIYKVNEPTLSTSSEGRYSSLLYSLELVCGKEYVSDEYDFIGWCAPDYFTEDVQSESIVQYFETESFNDLLTDEGFEEVSELPDHIYQWGETPSEYDLMW